MKFDFDDILIQPSKHSDVVSRKDINPYDDKYFLPLITAPMDTVINGENEYEFVKCKIIPCQPRGIKSNGFTSYSLKNFKEKFIDKTDKQLKQNPKNVLIDMANGHMRELENITRAAKDKYGESLVLMVGNIANPETYKMLSLAGADYIRVGIGNGGGCLTTQQLGVGYPMGSLIKECYDVSCSINNPAKIVADGGMKKYADIIKALALGADYVMVGSIFNKALESAGKTYTGKIARKCFEATDEQIETFKEKKSICLYKKFRGMSTKAVQRNWGVENLKTSEGVVKMQKVEYTIEGWIENFEHYLRSAMSYTNAFKLSEFIGQVEYNLITNNAFNRFNK